MCAVRGVSGDSGSGKRPVSPVSASVEPVKR